MATIYYADGRSEEYQPENGRDFELKELQEIVGGYIDTFLHTRRTHMAHTQTLPKGMALIETAEGRWFPALTPLTDTPHWVTCIDADVRCIPPALEAKPCQDREKGYDSRQQALEACCSWNEEMRLPAQWERLSARIEVYPERNAWYLDEIAHMTGGSPLLVTATLEAIAVVVAELHPGVKLIEAEGVTRDEAIEQLYQHVDAWWNGLAEVRAS